MFRSRSRWWFRQVPTSQSTAETLAHRNKPRRSSPPLGRSLVGVGALILTALFPALWACGPFFPNSLLLDGDAAVLQAPEIGFNRELDRLPMEPPPGLKHIATDASDREATVAAEIRDLRWALSSQGLGTNAIAEQLLVFSRIRADLEDHRRALETRAEQDSTDVTGPDPDASGPRPADLPGFHTPELPSVFPREFAHYLRGAQAWHEGHTNEARAAWQTILALPPADRRFKSTWAAYMLGRSWHDSDPARAERFYQATRTFARAGMADSANLAVASLGWEGQLRLRTNDLATAMRLYLDQYAAGSTQNAGPSLQLTAERVVSAPAEERLKVARDVIARRVVTAWLLASRGQSSLDPSRDDDLTPLPEVRGWLETLETYGASEVPLAEQLALLTYRSGDWDAAARWAALSGDSPVAEWIEAKLLLRQGKWREAAHAYSRVLARLPLAAPEREPGEAPAFVDSLSDASDATPARRRVLAESGVLHLTRGEFVQALDALLRAGYWQDAAYVAERVLTLHELRVYVDSRWPAASGALAHSEALELNSETSRRGQRERIRYLLARRLTRSNLGAEATPYYPATWQETHQTFLAQLRLGENPTNPPLVRARGWFAAAGIARTNGLELLGTEVGPDWGIWYGQYEYGPTHTARAAREAQHVRPTPEELRRAALHGADPEQRFHYRYQAAFLAWDAAQWMPDNQPETALMLHTAGSWLKTRDPKTADLFYKALVRRCRATELGAAADRKRWFLNP